MRKAEAYAPIVAKLVELTHFSPVHSGGWNTDLLEATQKRESITSELEGLLDGSLDSI